MPHNQHGITYECAKHCAIRDGVPWDRLLEDARCKLWSACTPDILWRQLLDELERAINGEWYGKGFRPSDDFAAWILTNLRHPWIREGMAELPKIPNPSTPTHRRMNRMVLELNYLCKNLQGENADAFCDRFEAHRARFMEV